MANYLITGANRGIGLEFCRQLKGKSHEVIAVCRSASEELKNLGVFLETNIDITSDENIADLVKRLNGKTHFPHLI